MKSILVQGIGLAVWCLLVATVWEDKYLRIIALLLTGGLIGHMIFY